MCSFEFVFEIATNFIHRFFKCLFSGLSSSEAIATPQIRFNTADWTIGMSS